MRKYTTKQIELGPDIRPLRFRQRTPEYAGQVLPVYFALLGAMGERAKEVIRSRPDLEKKLDAIACALVDAGVGEYDAIARAPSCATQRAERRIERAAKRAEKRAEIERAVYDWDYRRPEVGDENGPTAEVAELERETRQELRTERALRPREWGELPPHVRARHG